MTCSFMFKFKFFPLNFCEAVLGVGVTVRREERRMTGCGGVVRCGDVGGDMEDDWPGEVRREIVRRAVSISVGGVVVVGGGLVVVVVAVDSEPLL